MTWITANSQERIKQRDFAVWKDTSANPNGSRKNVYRVLQCHEDELTNLVRKNERKKERRNTSSPFLHSFKSCVKWARNGCTISSTLLPDWRLIACTFCQISDNMGVPASASVRRSSPLSASPHPYSFHSLVSLVHTIIRQILQYILNYNEATQRQPSLHGSS